MSKHARLSLSHSDLWLTCAAWPRITEDVGEEDNPAIEFGNKSHKILENMMLGNLPEGISEERGCAQVASDYIQNRWVEMGVDDAACLTEAKIDISSTNRKDLWGSADAILHNDEELEIVDLKTGPGTFVDETTSGQLRHYAIAAMETLGIKPPVIKLTIVQPRYWGSEDPIRTYTTTPDELYVWLAMVSNPAAMATDNPNAVGTVTVGCKKCAGRHVCQYRDDAVATALTGPAEIPEAMLTTMGVQEVDIRKNQDLVVYDNDRLSQVLTLVPVIRDYCDALEEHAQDIIMKGEQVTGYKVVASAGRTKWLDEDGVKEALNKTRISKNAFTQKLKTPKQVLALNPSAGLKKKLEGLIGKSDGGKVLVMNSDPRESLAPAFEVIPAIVQEQNPIEAPAELPAFLL